MGSAMGISHASIEKRDLGQIVLVIRGENLPAAITMCLAINSALRCSGKNVLILFLTAAAGPQLMGNAWIFQGYHRSCVYISFYSKRLPT